MKRPLRTRGRPPLSDVKRKRARSIMLDPPMMDHLDGVAEKYGIPFAEVVRKILDENKDRADEIVAQSMGAA